MAFDNRNDNGDIVCKDSVNQDNNKWEGIPRR